MILSPSAGRARAHSLAALLCLCIAGSACSSPENQPAARPERALPNILFIMADDHTAGAIRCYGSVLGQFARTPNLDRLAEQGTRFANCFCTNSICVPSRASILTGQYSHRNGVFSLSHALDPERDNVAKAMQAAGYQTAIVGKWHLKEEPSGFDYWNVLPGQGRYHDPLLKEKGSEKPRKHEGFSTDVITDLSIGWLEGREKNRPFFLMTHFKNSHEPWHYADRHAELYRDVEIPEPPSLWEDKSHRSVGSREHGFTIETMAGRMERKGYPTGQLKTEGLSREERKRAAYQKLAKDYLRCIAAIDENVGRLLEFLEREGLDRNTIVFYTSDQGYFIGEHDYIDKRWMFEESLRMPLLVRFPGRVSAGAVRDEILLNVDFAPTFLDLAGEAAPAAIQGVSFLPVLEGRTPETWRESMYYHYWQHGSRPAHYGVRTRRHKLIFFHGVSLPGKAEKKAPATEPGWELYDLERDPLELRNVYRDPEYAAVVPELKAELWRLKEELGDRDEQHPALFEVSERYRDR